ncbi:hypothetical protein [Nocardia sp. NPDC049149]|uniref:hypothetical protein n=1 Tax=Nocardia sp. NPDC049149 TaxID=3364315 RepID=UPI0037114644
MAGEAERARDRVLETIKRLNHIGKLKAEKTGYQYIPFTVDDITGDVRLIVDYPAGRNFPRLEQVCDSCADVMESYQTAFPGIRF